MGRDIHIQVQIVIDGYWRDVSVDSFTDPPPREVEVWNWLFGDPNDGYSSSEMGHPRGLPDNMTPEERDFTDVSGRMRGGGSEDLGDHSHTYATLQELRAVDWSRRPIFSIDDDWLHTFIFGSQLSFIA